MATFQTGEIRMFFFTIYEIRNLEICGINQIW